MSAVPTTWDETRVIHGKVGDYITVARRKGADWYVGSMTDGTPRELKIPLGFLGKGAYAAEEWADDPAAGPNGVIRRKATVTAADALTAAMAPAGGHAVRLTPIAGR